jgi:hypothetical protein
VAYRIKFIPLSYARADSTDYENEPGNLVLAVPADGTAQVFAMPPVGPPDTQVTNNSSVQVWLGFGAGALAGPNVSGNLVLLPGQIFVLSVCPGTS